MQHFFFGGLVKARLSFFSTALPFWSSCSQMRSGIHPKARNCFDTRRFGLIFHQLLPPKFGVVLRKAPALRTAMPKAAIHKYGKP